jgi:hypothetical protein
VKKLFLISNLVLLSFSGMTQNKLQVQESGDYTNAIGLRAGENSGITFKKLRPDLTGFEIILSAWPNDFAVFALYEKHFNIESAEGLRYYFGVGGHLSFNTWSRVYVDRDGRTWWYKDRTGVGAGIDGIAGLEYKIPPLPLLVSLDLKPYIELNTDGRVYVSPDPGISLRLTF